MFYNKHALLYFRVVFVISTCHPTRFIRNISFFFMCTGFTCNNLLFSPVLCIVSIVEFQGR